MTGPVISLMVAVPDAARAAAWYREALGATVVWDLGSVVGLEVAGAPLFLAEPDGPNWSSPAEAGTTTVRVEVFVDDPDAVWARAVAAGADGDDPVRDHQMPWGPHRQGGFFDPFGHRWLVGDRSPLPAHRKGGDPASLPSAADLLKMQLRHAWVNARWVLEGLDDEEYGWEPAPLCWSVRRRGPDVRGWGAGEWVCEDRWPPPDPLPVTTIAWRVVHLAAWTEVYLDWTFGGATALIQDFDVPGDCAGGLAWLHGAQDRFMAAVDDLDDATAFALRPAHWGESVPIAHLVTSMLTEHVHHIAEVGALRDVRRGRARRQPPPPPVAGPPWWLPEPR